MNLTNTEKNDIVLYTVKDIRRIFKCGRDKAYSLVNVSGFPLIKIGKKILVEKNALINWINLNSNKEISL